MVDSLYCLDRVVPEGMSQVSRRSEDAYINGAPSTSGHLLALLREQSYVPRGLTEIAEANQVRKNEPKWYFVPDQKKGPTIDPHVSNLRSRDFLFSRGSGPPLIHTDIHTESVRAYKYACVCMRVYVCTYKRVYINICTLTHKHKGIYTDLYIHACLYICKKR